MSIGTQTLLAGAGLALAALASATDARAAGAPNLNKVVVSSPLWADPGPTYHACNVANVSAAPVYLKFDLVDRFGVVKTSNGAYITVAPGAIYEFSASISGFAYCRIHLAGNVANIRANLSVFRWAGTYYETVANTDLH